MADTKTDATSYDECTCGHKSSSRPVEAGQNNQDGERRGGNEKDISSQYRCSEPSREEFWSHGYAHKDDASCPWIREERQAGQPDWKDDAS
jgi:hypothetical protein